MKRIKLTLIVSMLLIFFGCKRDALMPKLNIDTQGGLHGMTIAGEMSFDNSSKSRGFSYSGDHKNAINFASSPNGWNKRGHSPKILFIVRESSNSNKIVWAKEVSDGVKIVYDDSNWKVKYNSTTVYYKDKTNWLYIYVYDNTLSATITKANDEYSEVSIPFPSVPEKLKLATKSDYKIIFKNGGNSISFYSNGKQSNKILQKLSPLGTLLLFDIHNAGKSSWSFPSEYKIRILSNGFAPNGIKIDVINNNLPVNTWSTYHQGTVYYTDVKLSGGGSISQDQNSAFYGIYIMPYGQNNGGRGNEFTIKDPSKSPIIDLFNLNKTFDFYTLNGQVKHFSIDVNRKDDSSISLPGGNIDGFEGSNW